MEVNLQPRDFFANVYKCLEDPNTNAEECSRLLQSFNQYLLQEQIDPSLLDSYMPHFFNETESLLKFADESSKNKLLSKPCQTALEILNVILNNFYEKLQEKDILNLYLVASRIIKTSNIITGAALKVKLFDLVMTSLEKGECFVSEEARSVYKCLYDSLVLMLQLRIQSDTVRSKELMITGYLAKKHMYVIENPKQLRTIFLRNFVLHVKISSQSLIFGFYKGFGYFLENFPFEQDSSDEKNSINKLYLQLKELVVVKQNERKFGKRAAISFFGRNIKLFEQNVLRDYKFWCESLLMWLQCGIEEKKVAAAALQDYFHTLSRWLEENTGEICEDVVRYFMVYCKATLIDKQISNNEKRSAIFCLGEFSSAFYRHLSDKEVTELFLFIMQIFESIFIREGDVLEDEQEYLPDYVKAVANFLKFKNFSAGQFFCLEKGVVTMVKSFHQLPDFHHNLVVDSIHLTLYRLTNTKYFDNFLEAVVYQGNFTYKSPEELKWPSEPISKVKDYMFISGIIWSCSHQHLSALVFSNDTDRKIITVKNYFPLWTGLLKLSPNRHYDKYGFYLEDRKFVQRRLIREVIKTFMILINKLNVSVRLKNDNVCAFQLETAYTVEKTDDYAIFLNLIDFYKTVFECIECRSFAGCIGKMLDHLIAKCSSYPLLSGFYKLLSHCLRIARKLGFFDDADELVRRDAVARFLARLLDKMPEYKDDLFVSCLQVLLEAPVEVVKDVLPLCSAPLVAAFDAGRSYFPLAEMGIEALEYWQDNVDRQAFDALLAEVLPSLDSYLRSRFLGTASAPERRKRASRHKKVLRGVEPELVSLQGKIVRFVGRQSLRNCRSLVFSDKVFAGNVTTFGRSCHLKVALPYDELDLNVYLDAVLPRVIELALYSSDRKTRVVSCELLHACVIVFLGRAKQMTTEGLNESTDLLSSFAMPLLLLGCDIDGVVKQIFEPLVLQLIHWYTTPGQLSGPHAVIIVNTLMDGITHPTNSNLKDFSGQCVGEYLKWTLKHDRLQPEKSIKVLLRKMRFFSLHPSPSKKSGAALIFNSVHRLLREEERFVSAFWLDILHMFVSSLDSIADSEESSAVVLIKRSLSQIQRVIVEKPSMFRKLDGNRVIPNDLKTGLLKDVSTWLLQKTCSNSKHCSQASMDLFISITPVCTRKHYHLRHFVAEHLDKNLRSLYDSKLTGIDSVRDNASLSGYLRNLTCCINGYAFVARHRLEVIDFDERVFQEIDQFLEKMKFMDGLNATCAPFDRDSYGKLKNSCVLSILRFFLALVQNYTNLDLDKKRWSDNFWKLLADVTFAPQELGLNNELDFKDLLVVLFNSILSKLDCHSLIFALQRRIDTYSSPSIQTNTNLKKRNLLNGIVLLGKSSIYSQLDIAPIHLALDKFIIDFLGEATDELIFVNRIPDTTFTHLSNLFELVLQRKSRLENLTANLLLSDRYVKSSNAAQNRNVGLFFMSTFDKAFVPAIILNFDAFLSLGLRSNIELTLNMVLFILEWICNNKCFEQYREGVVNCLLTHWNDFSHCLNVNRGMELLTLVFRLKRDVPSSVEDWLVNCIVKDRNNDVELFGLLAKAAHSRIPNRSDYWTQVFTVFDEDIHNQTQDEGVKRMYFNKLLTFIPVVRSQEIFEYLINIFVKIEPTVNINNLISKYMNNLDLDTQEVTLQRLYNIATIKIAKEILPSALSYANIQVFERFFITNIRNILQSFEEDNLERSIISFLLIDVLFLRLPISAEGNCAICFSANEPKLLMQLLKRSLEAFKLRNNANPLSRIHKCCAYNALASIVSNSFNTIDFYERLFVRKLDGRDVLWHNIVDLRVNYDFPMEMDALPARRKVLVNVRDVLKRRRSAEKDSLRYVESQRIYNSSLREDVTKFDFSESVLRDGEVVENEETSRSDELSSEVSLDVTEIDRHECMATVCAVVQRIFDEGICRLPDENGEDFVVPMWINGVASTISDKNTHKNVKIFLVKVIDNKSQIFGKFAKVFLKPLVQFVIDEIAGKAINYFVTDVLVLIATWSTEIRNPSEDDVQSASKLLHHLIRHIHYDRRDIFKYNVEILKVLVESWKTHLTTIKESALFELFFNEITTEAALYVSSVLLANNLKFWRAGGEKEILNFLLKSLKSNEKRVYRAASETLGLLLITLKDDVNSSVLSGIPVDKFAICLEGVAISYPQIIDCSALAQVLPVLFHGTSDQKLTILKLILKRLDFSQDVLHQVSDFKIVDWHELINDSNVEVKILALEIVRKSIQVFSCYSQFQDILEALSRHIYHPNSTLRSCLYNVTITTYELLKTEPLKKILLAGLMDPDAENRQKIADFWSKAVDLPRSVVPRFCAALSQLYEPKFEDKLLNVSTYILLDVLKENNKYNSSIFEHPLEDCDFEEYKLFTNWKVQHPSVVPLFAETLDANSFPNDSNEDGLVVRKSNSYLQFLQTQSYHEQEVSKLSSLNKTLNIRQKTLDPFKNPNNMTLSPQHDKLTKRRFLKDKSKIDMNMALGRARKRQETLQNINDYARQKENTVTIYRSYRKGDFPDVQIPLAAVLKPLEVLIWRDDEVCKVIFLEIFAGLVSSSGSGEFLIGILEIIRKIFNSSVQFNQNLFGALLDVLLKCKGAIAVEPELVARVAQESDLQAAGALVIEEYIIAGLDISEPTSSKRAFNEDSREMVYWVKLAELYKDLEEWDTVKSIFLEKTDSQQSIRKALSFESKFLYREARKLYSQLIQSERSPSIRDFYLDSCFRCFASLCEWEKIPAAVGNVVLHRDAWEGMWEDEWATRKLLPWYIKAEVRSQLTNLQVDEGFLARLNRQMLYSDRRGHLVQNFAEELCILWLIQNDMRTAKQYLKTPIKNFLDEWYTLNPVFQTQRYQKLLRLCNVAEVVDFTDIYDNFTDDTGRSLNALRRKWHSVRDDISPSVDYSETKLLYRQLFINVIVKKLRLMTGEDFRREIAELESLKRRMDLELIEVSTNLGNYYVARKYLRKYAGESDEEIDGFKGSVAYLKAHVTEDPVNKIELLLEALEILNRPSSDLKTNSKLFDALLETSQILSRDEVTFARFKSKINLILNKSVDAPPDMEWYAFDRLRNSAGYDSLINDSNLTLKSSKVASDAYIKLVEFVKDKEAIECRRYFVQFVLRAMRLDSPIARQWFPCVLTTDGLGHALCDLFIEESAGIPTWMFLGWVPQLLVQVDTPKVFALSLVIIRLAETYPQAVMYAYRLSKGYYKFVEDDVASQARRLISKLDELLLADENVNGFLKALSYVTVPEALLKYHASKMAKIRDAFLMKNYARAVQTDIFDENCGTEKCDNFQGDMYKAIKGFRRDFNEFTKEEVETRHVHMIIHYKLDQIFSKRSKKLPLMLKNYSPWLANFTARKLDMDLEIPGQYDGQKKPLTEYHVRIFSFCPEVKIMDSLTKPIKVTILGIDTKEYSFLIKSGEDIRQDQRIMQLFRLINGFIKSEAVRSNSDLEILTYQVIPLTSNLGLIQWFENTQSLNALLTSTLKSPERIDAFKKLRCKYENNLNITNNENFHGYGRAAITLSKEKIVDNFSVLVKEVPWDILRTSLWSLSVNTENFIALRNNFIKSHAAICACHWILGIGDRHLDNILVCIKTGKLLGIDFGHAFGTATQVQPVPELVPFRLTPHMRALMEPLSERGPFKEYMAHCLHCLRVNRTSLLATMDVFIKEPSLNWLEHSEDDGTGENWYPQVKIRQAKRKLEGACSMDIMVDELRDGSKVEDYTRAYVDHVREVNPLYIGRDDLSVEEQVNCLISHAIDYNLLGRMFAGWSPWI